MKLQSRPHLTYFYTAS